MIARLFIAVLCLSMALGQVALPVAHAGQALHVSLSDDHHASFHDEGIPHQHDEGGDYQKDDSADAVLHVLGDACHAASALRDAPGLVEPAVFIRRLAMFADASGRPPDVDGLRRPPRLST